jgi:hypothetical protein
MLVTGQLASSSTPTVGTAHALESRSVADNKLFYGDNLDVLRRYLRDESSRSG